MTRWTILPCPIGTMQTIEVHTLPLKPSLTQIRSIVEPHLAGMNLERVRVFWEGEYTDMFVGQDSCDGIRNVKATEIYRNNILVHEPGTYPESLPPVCGPAVLFSRRVWY